MTRSTFRLFAGTVAVLFILVAAGSFAGCEACQECCAALSGDKVESNGTGTAAKDGSGNAGSATKGDDAISLFDGKTLGKWKQVQFGGDGEVEIKNGELILNMGEPLTGVTWQGEVPAKTNYEISLEAQRAQGTDFFLGLTVPVKDKPITLVLGGWGGGVCGLSSLDGSDASDNDTANYMEFTTGQWYKVRMQVLDEEINVWLDGKPIIQCDIKGRQIGIRPEVELSVPLGITSFQTVAKYRNIKLKKIDPATLKKKAE